jgi:hypothetical protein
MDTKIIIIIVIAIAVILYIYSQKDISYYKNMGRLGKINNEQCLINCWAGFTEPVDQICGLIYSNSADVDECKHNLNSLPVRGGGTYEEMMNPICSEKCRG